MTALEGFYKIGKWADLTNYECVLCPFSALTLPEFEEHFLNRHAETPAQYTGSVLVADKRGRDITDRHTQEG